MTQCSQSEFEFKGHFSRRVGAAFDGGTMTSDGGALLLRETDRRLNLLPRLAECFLDRRNPVLVTHPVAEMVAQRVYALALGYEDLNDHEQLRQDPLLHVLAGKAKMDEPLAGKSTLNRLELGDGSPHRYKKITYWKDSLDTLLVSVFLEAFETPPEEIVLDLDTTDVELNGKQEGRFFHGYYDEYCYLPLYIFAGEHLLCVRLREADRDAADGCLAEVKRIVEQIRARWSQVHIILRGDSGFCRDELMDWAEQKDGVDYVFGVPRNNRLRRLIAPQLAAVAAEHARTGKPARQLYEDLYCARGDMENRIKEQFHLFAGRASTETMRANQFRMYLSGMAYVLVSGLRRLGLKATELATAQAATIRGKLFKIGARVTVSVRRVWLSMASSYPHQRLFREVWANQIGRATCRER